MRNEKNITLKTLTKSSVWDLQENDVFRLWEAAEKDNDLKDNQRRYLDIIRSAFEIEPVKIDRTEVLDKLIDRGFKIGTFRIDDKNEKYAIKKRPIMRVTDLTYENIGHITATKLIEVLERNFGGGWDSLSQSIKDIIESGFDISTTTLPKDRLKKPGGLYEKKLADDYEVLVVPKGTWVEAIFAKEKPKQEKIRLKSWTATKTCWTVTKTMRMRMHQRLRITTMIQMRTMMHSMTTSSPRKATVLPSRIQRTWDSMMQRT